MHGPCRGTTRTIEKFSTFLPSILKMFVEIFVGDHLTISPDIVSVDIIIIIKSYYMQGGGWYTPNEMKCKPTINISDIL